MASKNRQLSTVKWPSNECGFSLEFYLFLPLSPSVSWILESLYHISAIALFVRHEEVSLEPWWLYLQSLNTEVWSAFENSFWLLGQCRKALAMFHSYFLVITNTNICRDLPFISVLLHCTAGCSLLQPGCLCGWQWSGWVSPQRLFGNQKKCFLYPKECFSREQRAEVMFRSPCVFQHCLVQCRGGWGSQAKSHGILGIVLGSCRCIKKHFPPQPAMPTQWCV